MAFVPFSSARNISSENAVIIITLVFFLSQIPTFAQKDGLEIEESTSLFGQLYGMEVLGISINYNLNYKFSINGGIGIGPAFHLGGSFYLNRKPAKATSFYIGAQIGSIREALFFDGFGDAQLAVYLPIGFEYIATKGFTIQIDVGPSFTNEDWGQPNTLPFYGSLKIGYTFRKKR